MPERVIGTWNARNAFGDNEMSTTRMRGAIDVIDRMDADIVAVQESMARGVHETRLEEERWQEVVARMGRMGYVGAKTNYSPYSDERDVHYMSIWSRDGGVDDTPTTVGRRHGLRVRTAEGLNVSAIHLDDVDADKRVASVDDLLVSIDPADAEVIVGGFDDMYRRDPKTRLLRVAGRITSRFTIKEYYDRTKRLQRLGGKMARTASMAEGLAMSRVELAGFHDADPQLLPTISNGILGYAVDHIVGSPRVVFEDFRQHDRTGLDGTPLSDHMPLSVVAKQ